MRKDIRIKVGVVTGRGVHNSVRTKTSPRVRYEVSKEIPIAAIWIGVWQKVTEVMDAKRH